jgi:MbtH protein
MDELKKSDTTPTKRSLMNKPPENYLNPFDDDSSQFLVLVNAKKEYSLWPVFADQPAGWAHCFGPASREACLAHVEQHWHSINPFALAS